MSILNRREMLLASGALVASSASKLCSQPTSAESPMRSELSVISRQGEFYHGWPTVIRRRLGQLMLVWSGGREAHVCPFGRVEMMMSDDEGRTWAWPRVLLDSALDDRDAGALETDKGSLLVTTFTSLAYEPVLQRAEKVGAGQPRAWPQERLERWQAAYRRLTPEQRRAELGSWIIRSTDGGISWSARISCPVNSPHGPIQLPDGRLLYAGKELWNKENRIGVCESTDDGQTWRWLASIPTRASDDHRQYHELHAIATTDGRILVHIRNQNQVNNGETLQSESSDSGKTWSEPKSIGVWGLPSHLLRLTDGRLLMTYGHRHDPFGNQARISADHGQSWSVPITVSADGAGGDLGYPSTVQIKDGSLLTVWYERMAKNNHAVLRQARWPLPV